jgi:hypothetical protein
MSINSIIAQGKVVGAIITAAIIIVTFWSVYRSEKGKPIGIRPMPQIQAMDDGVDIAVEQGKPVFVTVGCYAYLSGTLAAMTIAGLNVTRYIAGQCVRKGAEVRFPVSQQPECLPIIDGIYREQCVAEGKPELYRRENVQFFGSGSGYAVGVMGWLAREGCALFVMVGALGGTSADVDTINFAKMAGALSTGGTCRWAHQGTWAMMTDYPMFTDDVYAVGALTSRNTTTITTIGIADVGKIALIILTIVGVALAFAGLPFVKWMAT